MINVDRSIVPVPTIRKNYTEQVELYEVLGKIFLNKCYLCETYEPNPTCFEIEHFIPHKGDLKLKYQWENIYLACGEPCNSYKGTILDLLDPCNPAHDVERSIIYEVTPVEHEPHFYALEEQNPTIVNTCNLLENIHNGHHEKSKGKTSSLRNAIKRRVTELKNEMLAHYRAKESSKSVDRQRAEQRIRKIVSRKSPYTMLMRSIAKEHGFDYLFD